MEPYYETGNIRIYHGRCEEVLDALDLSVSAVVTDPPYGLAFMGRDWDDFDPREYQRFCEDWASSVRGVMRPGAPLLAFSGTRTFHRAICGIEDAGFTIKDCLSWTYGEGFPKSHDLQDATGREAWDGYGTALAPSWEPICYATKPREGTYAENALEHGVAGLNIDAGRVETDEEWNGEQNFDPDAPSVNDYGDGLNNSGRSNSHPQGRWPANVVFDEVAAERLDGQSGTLESGELKPSHNRSQERNCYGEFDGYEPTQTFGGDTGGASRFFYTAKASKSDRNAGLPDRKENDWPTVKPRDLMGWLLRLVEMPSDNLILDPFAGSGTTAYVAQQMGLPCVAIDQSKEACELTKQRLSTPSLFS